MDAPRPAPSERARALAAPSLNFAVSRGRLEAVRALSNGASAASLHDALRWAAFAGHLKLVQLLVQQGAALDAADAPTGRTAVHWAAYLGHAAVFRWLVGQGADVLRPESRLPQFTAVDVLVWKGRGELLSWLLERAHGAPHALQAPLLHALLSPAQLCRAAAGGHLQLVRWLLGLGAPVDAPDDDAKTALWHAAEQRHAPLCSWLVAHGASAALLSDGARAELLAVGAAAGDAALLRAALDAGAHPAEAGVCGVPPVHWSLRRGHHHCARLLLLAGADVLAPWADGGAVGARGELLAAARRDEPQPERAQCDPDALLERRRADERGRTLLHHAAATEGSQWLPLLVDDAALARHADCEGRLPLHVACAAGHRACAAALAERMAARGEPLDVEDGYGFTPADLLPRGVHLPAVRRDCRRALRVHGRRAAGLAALCAALPAALPPLALAAALRARHLEAVPSLLCPADRPLDGALAAAAVLALAYAAAAPLALPAPLLPAAALLLTQHELLRTMLAPADPPLPPHHRDPLLFLLPPLHTHKPSTPPPPPPPPPRAAAWVARLLHLAVHALAAVQLLGIALLVAPTALPSSAARRAAMASLLVAPAGCVDAAAAVWLSLPALALLSLVGAAAIAMQLPVLRTALPQARRAPPRSFPACHTPCALTSPARQVSLWWRALLPLVECAVPLLLGALFLPLLLASLHAPSADPRLLPACSPPPLPSLLASLPLLYALPAAAFWPSLARGHGITPQSLAISRAAHTLCALLTLAPRPAALLPLALLQAVACAATLAAPPAPPPPATRGLAALAAAAAAATLSLALPLPPHAQLLLLAAAPPLVLLGVLFVQPPRQLLAAAALRLRRLRARLPLASLDAAAARARAEEEEADEPPPAAEVAAAALGAMRWAAEERLDTLCRSHERYARASTFSAPAEEEARARLAAGHAAMAARLAMARTLVLGLERGEARRPPPPPPPPAAVERREPPRSPAGTAAAAELIDLAAKEFFDDAAPSPRAEGERPAVARGAAGGWAARDGGGGGGGTPPQKKPRGQVQLGGLAGKGRSSSFGRTPSFGRFRKGGGHTPG
ncbi:hypothetical protein AB1Y20_002781 [Prymnesium parvum]|uniref:Uncharacterized protein n=1 Tax=Prymnesium parvum TaxID=97485 RepID=A0AB34J8X9_PRYPA